MSLIRRLEVDSPKKQRWFLFFLKRRLLVVLVIAFLVGIVLEIWTVNRLATYGEQIAKFEQVKYGLELENQLLRNQISERSSLVNLIKESVKLGLLPVTKIEYVASTSASLNQ